MKRLPKASPSSASNPAPLVARCSMTGGISWPVRDQDSTQVTVVPAKGRNPADGAMQNPELTGRRSARQLCRPLLEHIVTRGDPAPHGRDPTRLDGPPEDGDAVQLNEHNAVYCRVGDGFGDHPAPQQRRRERVISAGAPNQAAAVPIAATIDDQRRTKR